MSSEHLPVVLDAACWTAVGAALAAGAGLALERLVAQRAVIFLPRGTPLARVAGGGGGRARVRVLAGPARGRLGWVAEALAPAN